MRTSTRSAHDGNRHALPAAAFRAAAPAMVTLVALALIVTSTTVAVAANRDLWIRSVSYVQTPSDTTLDISIEVQKQGTLSVAGAILMLKRNQVAVRTFTLPDPITNPFTHTMAVRGGDTIEAVVDPADLFPELNELNNKLTWDFPSDWSLVNLHGPFPETITISEPAELTLEATGIVEQRRTGFFPSALLLVPPFNWWQAEHDGYMETELQQTQTYYQEDERSAGVTAALAIEAGFSVQGVGASVGAEIEAEMSVALGRTITQTYSESFAAAVSNTYIPSGDHTVVLSQTRYDVMRYVVTTPGQYYGKSMWIAVPQISDTNPNPELTGELLGVYPELKDPQAVDLDGHHTIGKINTYNNNSTAFEAHGWHLHVSTMSIDRLAEKQQTIGTAAVDWSVSIETGTYHTTSQCFRCNLFAKSEFAGSSVQASFGSSEGSSHKVYQGKSHQFHFHIAPVIQSKNRYKVGGWAANYTFDHGTPQRRDGLLVLCYYVHEPPADNTSPVREILIGGSWDDWTGNWDVSIAGWPGSQHLGTAILDGLTVNINSPVVILLNDFYQAYRDLIDNEIVWATSLEPPPPELDTFMSTAELARNQLDDIIYNDPENPVHIQSVLAMIDNVHEAAHWTFNPRACRIEPEVPRAGESVAFFYNPLRGSLPQGGQVLVRIGFDGWQGGHTDWPMTLNAESGMWESGPLPVPADVTVVNYVFADDMGHVDDRRGQEWHAETVGPVRTHRSGNIDVSFTAEGMLGFTDGSQSAGAGFCYPAGGTNWVYLGGLWVGNDDFVANRDYDADPDTDWAVGDTEPGGILRDICQGAHLTQAAYSDAEGPSPRGLRVEQSAVTQSSNPDDDFVIVTYHVRNESDEGLDDLWVGQFADFDLDAQSALQNWGDTDAELSLAYMYRDQNTPYVGVCLLDRHATANLTLIHNPTFVYPTQYLPDTEKSLFLRAADPAHSVPTATEESDWSVLVSAGPFNLPAGEVLAVTFAIVAGDDLVDLRANAERARVWLLPGSGPTGVGDAGVPPVTLAPVLLQNVPNPFNPSTQIAFDLPQRGRVVLRIYDVEGRLVRTLIDGMGERGRTTLTWDARNEAGRPVGSGVYLYQLDTDQGAVPGRKMTVVR